jgi:hypothetical protein
MPAVEKREQLQQIFCSGLDLTFGMPRNRPIN